MLIYAYEYLDKSISLNMEFYYRLVNIKILKK